MDKNRISYVHGKLWLAANALAANPERIPERVAKAMRYLTAVVEDDFPEELKDDFQWLKQGANQALEGALDDETSVAAARILFELNENFESQMTDSY